MSDAPTTLSTTRVTRLIKAPRAAVYRAFVDPDLVAAWMSPPTMRCHVHTFDARPGGEFRVSLTYEDPASAGLGKSSASTDSYHGRFIELVPDQKIVEVLEFETADPALQGQMTIAVLLADAPGGTEVTAVHQDLPPGLRPADNELGWTESLAKLAVLLE